MSNQSLINESFNCTSSETLPSLDQLLESLGFVAWKTITVTFILPTISCLGLILCSLSFWIFFQKNFKDPVFFYYRLLCIVYIIHLLHNIPRGIFDSPKYFPKINTYLASIYIIYYAPMSVFLFHLEETIQMAILLTRIKIFNSFVDRHFNAKPWLIFLALFLTCLFIDLPFAFSVKVKSLGTYFYFDSNGLKQYAILYYFTSSDFSLTLFGKIILLFCGLFLNLIVSVIVGVILNIVSVRLYRSYVRERREKEKRYTRVAFSKKDQNQAITSANEEIHVVILEPQTLQSKKLTQKEINENKSEKNMFYMALSLCSISVISRILFIFVFIYFFFFNSFSESLILVLINISLYSIVPTSGTFVFYSFNRMFREEFRKKFINKEISNAN